MKKTIITTVALVALAFASCKKDNLQPTNSSSNIEQINNETSIDDDKVVDARNKFLGVWKGYYTPMTGTMPGSMPIKVTITKSNVANQLKLVQVINESGYLIQRTYYVKVTGSSKLSFLGYKTTNNSSLQIKGSKTSSTSKKLKYVLKDTIEESTMMLTKQ